MAASTSDMSYVESEQFALNFPLVIGSVGDYMKKEYNEGRLKDANYATVQAQAIQSAIQATLTLTMQTDSQKAQTDLLAQQVLTEVQKTITETNQGNLLASQKLLVDQQELTEIKKTITETNQGNLLASQKALIDQQQLTEVKKTITETNQGTLVANQATLISNQAAEIAANASKQRAVQDAQITQMNAETAYTGAKQQIAIDSRIDNLIIEDLKAQQQQLATVGAGGLIPTTQDFSAANSLRQAVYNRATGAALGAITFTASDGVSAGQKYVKAT